MSEARKLRLSCADGYPLAAELHAAPAARGAVLVAPALGVPRRFYSDYARFLATQGFSTLVLDYRGVGDSAQGPVRGALMQMADWGRLDIEAALRWFETQLKPARIFLVGHSAGGQLPALAEASEKLSGMVLVAASAPALRYYPLRDKLGPAFLWHFAVPLFSRGRDQFPSKRLGFSSVDVPTGVMRQWAAWSRASAYLFSPEFQMDTARYARLSIPMLSYCFLDDAYAPPAAVNALLEHYPAAKIEKREVPKPAKGTIGHFGYFRERQRDTLWRDTADWLTRLC